MATLTKSSPRTALIAARRKPRYVGKKMSLEAFKSFKSEDGFKYEWNNGTLISETTSMKNTERLIIARLMDSFTQTVAYTNGARLLPETGVLISSLDKYRIPDLSYFTQPELERSARGEEPIPSFVIELISPSDRIAYYQEKISEYFLSGTKAVWLVFPKEKQIWSFTSPTDVKIHSGASRCSATPAVDDMVISPDDLFN
jgi:Uma2 family endonuclease